MNIEVRKSTDFRFIIWSKHPDIIKQNKSIPIMHLDQLSNYTRWALRAEKLEGDPVIPQGMSTSL